MSADISDDEESKNLPSAILKSKTLKSINRASTKRPVGLPKEFEKCEYSL